MHITTCHNGELKQYFFCNHHSDFNLGDSWVPVSCTLPMSVVPRPTLPTGIINTIAEYKMIFFYDETEIEHPRPELDEIKDITEFYKALDADKFCSCGDREHPCVEHPDKGVS